MFDINLLELSIRIYNIEITIILKLQQRIKIYSFIICYKNIDVLVYLVDGPMQVIMNHVERHVGRGTW